MSRVEEIERAILELSSEEFREITLRIHELEQKRWEEQLDYDAAAGKLDFLIEEARNERKEGSLRAWPPSE